MSDTFPTPDVPDIFDQGLLHSEFGTRISDESVKGSFTAEERLGIVRLREEFGDDADIRITRTYQYVPSPDQTIAFSPRFSKEDIYSRAEAQLPLYASHHVAPYAVGREEIRKDRPVHQSEPYVDADGFVSRRVLTVQNIIDYQTGEITPGGIYLPGVLTDSELLNNAKTKPPIRQQPVSFIETKGTKYGGMRIHTGESGLHYVWINLESGRDTTGFQLVVLGPNVRIPNFNGAVLDPYKIIPMDQAIAMFQGRGGIHRERGHLSKGGHRPEYEYPYNIEICGEGATLLPRLNLNRTADREYNIPSVPFENAGKYGSNGDLFLREIAGVEPDVETILQTRREQARALHIGAIRKDVQSDKDFIRLKISSTEEAAQREQRAQQEAQAAQQLETELTTFLPDWRETLPHGVVTRVVGSAIQIYNPNEPQLPAVTVKNASDLTDYLLAQKQKAVAEARRQAEAEEARNLAEVTKAESRKWFEERMPQLRDGAAKFYAAIKNYIIDRENFIDTPPLQQVMDLVPDDVIAGLYLQVAKYNPEFTGLCKIDKTQTGAKVKSGLVVKITDPISGMESFKYLSGGTDGTYIGVGKGAGSNHLIGTEGYDKSLGRFIELRQSVGDIISPDRVLDAQKQPVPVRRPGQTVAEYFGVDLIGIPTLHSASDLFPREKK